MGGRGRGHKRGRTQRRDFKDGRSNEWKKARVELNATDDGSDALLKGWEPFVLENSSFELYYREQGVVPEEEWEEFMATLRKPLPTTFRINTTGQFATSIRKQLQTDFYERLKDGVEDGTEGRLVQPIRPLAWYPDNLAWQLGYSRTELRRVAVLEKIHEFLKQENEIGSITRQEAVSMVPPLLLDVQPHHRVLDMCAAPGSKTFQLLEMIHSRVGPGGVPLGMVIANDSDVQRCHLLVHQTKRMCSPNIIVTNHEAQRFPSLRSHVPGGDSLMFDRILCDVPCSGDGTVRKAPDIWKKWNTGVGNGLHRLQIQIAMRGVALLKVGGKLVYSTCSLNPVENEAVVSAILRQSGGSMELLDVSGELSDLKRRPGIKSWKVKDRGQWLSSASEVNMHRAGSILPSMFPSGRGHVREDPNVHSSQHQSPGACVSNGSLSTPEVEKDRKGPAEDGCVQVNRESLEEPEELVDHKLKRLPTQECSEVSDLPLERCMRILPHDQDTGGFFIAVLRKVFPWKLHPQKNTGCEEDSVNHLSSFQISNGVFAEKQLDMNQASSPLGGVEIVNQVCPFICGTLAPDQAHTELEAARVPAGIDLGKKETREFTDVVAAQDQEQESLYYEDDASPLPDDEVLQAADKTDAGAEALVVDDGAEVAVPPDKPKSRFQQQGKWRGVDPVIFLQDEVIIQTLIDYYGLDDSFPLRGRLITRSEDSTRLKRIYFVSEGVSDTIRGNCSAGYPMKVTSAGLKIFERQQSSAAGTSACPFRIVSEGLPTLLPHMTKQIVNCKSTKDFRSLLSGKALPFHAIEDSSFATGLQDLQIGCCVIAFSQEESKEDASFAPEIGSRFAAAVGSWRGRHNVSLLLSKAEAGQMIERLFLLGGDEFDHEMDSSTAKEADVPLQNECANI